MINFKIQVLPRITEGSGAIKIARTDFSHEALAKLSKDERFRELKLGGIDLFDGMKLRLLSQEDVEILLTSSHLLHGTLLLPGTPVLEKCVNDKDKDYQRIDETMRNGVLALRLLKGGIVQADSLFFILVSEEGQRLAVKSSGNEPILQNLRQEYALKFDEIAELRSILEKVHKAHATDLKNLLLACRRFQRVYTETDPEDKLIDMIIAFEALFIRGEKIKIIGERIASDCSRLIGETEKDQEKIKEFLSKAYRIRNSIVHGSEYPQVIEYQDYRYFLGAFVFFIEDYLRRSIKRSLDTESSSVL